MKSHLKTWLPALLIGLILGAGVFYMNSQPDTGMYVTFKNDDNVMIDSLQLNFGNANGQSDLLLLRLAPGEERLVLLNHDPGMGFNVKVHYSGGDEQEFCAKQYDDQRVTTVSLRR
ncbi:hypothetical protein [Nitrincola schmidtii]|uniref:hypothetical protein n=1 Tax=Nitrincola schmidtii TaxID=1730894 RepID=UPI00124D9BE1|nr:hypothetical protein [Nitrincola schmidtii]